MSKSMHESRASTLTKCLAHYLSLWEEEIFQLDSGLTVKTMSPETVAQLDENNCLEDFPKPYVTLEMYNQSEVKDLG